jgi:NAD(P)-dependent dehydrogenase (short-subunit alcohol dehydrogenase family)
MPGDWLREQFSLEGTVAIVTGGGGALGGAMARGLAQSGARLVLVGRRQSLLDTAAAAINACGAEAIALAADVHDRAQLDAVRDATLARWGRIDILVNAAGGVVPGATLAPGSAIFDLPIEAFREVIDLNLLGTILPSQVFGAVMAAAGRGSIVNISSMTATRAISRVVGYSAAKAAIDNFTRWLAVELARSYGEGLRVNAIAPGFFIGEQNRALLIDDSGAPTERGAQIIAHTPAGRFGEADELAGTVVWLCSHAARFVNGVVVPVDGGFSIFGGV